MSRRDLLLREIGLSPVWRLRTGMTETAADASPVAESASPAVIETTAPPSVSSPTAPPGRAPAAPPAWLDDAPPPSAPPPQQADEPAPPADGRTQRIHTLDWDQLQGEVAGCQACPLCKTRRNTVFGVGDARADWLIVGEAPGGEEDRQGEPFVGPAGKLLDNMLNAVGLKRGDNVFIANVLKCRPPQNRDPAPHEVQQCEPFLLRQIELIQPKIIVALGRFAAQSLLKSDARIGSLRGKVHTYHGVPLVITYHPAYLLRNQPDKARAWEDLCLARKTYREAGPQQ
ncbi:uracil-DNA glycosylase [Chitinivorax sp. PXF-14]|uniref:uracil-DNA glycosylase n=1 Tax=Chitinivorax sp. PXF-14 TaxID=3230488 RepID=UPI003466CB2B